MKTKAEIRRELDARVTSLGKKEKARQSSVLCERLLNDAGILASRIIGIYLPLPDEIDLRPALSILFKKGIQLALPFPETTETEPLVFGQTRWQFHEIFSLDPTETGPWELDFPDHGAGIETSSIDTLLVPGRGFTLSGQRIGRGKGIYDRLLQQYEGRSIGIGFDCQIIDNLPYEPHDIPLTEIWTS